MTEIIIRSAQDSDHDHLLQGMIDQQDFERALHDTRRPGAQTAERYLMHVKANIAQTGGVLLVAQLDGVFAGYAACWVELAHNINETADSNRFGYVADTYVVAEFRGRGIASRLLEAAESHLRAAGILRVRIGVLARNVSALRAYEKYGFEPYEIVMEKRPR